jgi:hypothetical protein
MSYLLPFPPKKHNNEVFRTEQPFRLKSQFHKNKRKERLLEKQIQNLLQIIKESIIARIFSFLMDARKYFYVNRS